MLGFAFYLMRSLGSPRVYYRLAVKMTAVLAAATCAHAPRPIAADGNASNQSASSGGPFVCTLKGCGDGLKITIRRDHGNVDPVGVVLAFDGRTITCPPPVRAHTSFCAPRGSVDLDDAADCSREYIDDAGGHACPPLGQLAEVISVPVSESAIDVTLARDGQKIASRTIRPRYRTVYINGVGCAGCKIADETWVLSRWSWWPF
jgi:hypothetical protein